MASKNTSSSPNGRQKVQRSNSDSARWVAGLLLLFIGVFAASAVLFSFFTWAADQSGLLLSPEERATLGVEPGNLCGWAGARLGRLLVDNSFGVSGILIPVMVVLVGVRVIRQRPLLFNHSILSLFLILILGSLTLGFAFSDKWSLCSSTGWGGAFGIETAALLRTHIGVLGTLILLLGCWILTGVFINRNFINTVNRAGNVLVDKSGKLVGTVAQKVPSLQSLVVSRPREEEDDEQATPAESDVREVRPTPPPAPVAEEEPQRERAAPPAPPPADTPSAGGAQAAVAADGEEDDPFVVHPVGVAPVSGGVQTVNDYYARNRVTDDDPFEEHTLGAEEPEGADAAPLPSRLAGEEDEFVEIDLSDGTDDTGGAVPADTPAGAEDADAEENPFLDDDEPFTVKDAGAPAAAGDAPEGVVVTVEEHHDALLDEHRITTEAYDPLKDLVNYRRPSVALLEDYLSDSEVTDEEIYENKSRIEETLKNFGIPIQRIKATTGPTVTLYEIVQAQGVKISRIQNLQNDIAQSLKALGIRIIAPIPGKGTIGIEVPNRNKQIVSMYSAVRSMKFQEAKAELPVVIGRTIQNENYVFDLAKMPHLLVAGATGQGKSVGLNAIITSLLYKKHPAQLKFVMIDPKMVEFSLYAKIERHFLAKMESEEEAIITDPRKAVYTLNSLCIEMENRLSLCKDAGARNIKEYNEKFTARRLNPLKGHRYLPYIVVVVDEFADLIMTAKEVEGPVMRLAQKARAVGIHLIIATQRPDVKVITGGIKANFPARIAFRVMQMIDSRTIIDRPGAEQLIGRGDMLFSNNGELTRIQCALVDTPEVERIVEYISKQQSYTSAYNLPDYTPDSGGGEAALGSESSAPVKYDSKFAEIARDAVSGGQISTSMIQRNYEVGFNRAGRIMMQLERAGIVGRQQGAKPRDILYHDLPSLEAKLQELGLF